MGTGRSGALAGWLQGPRESAPRTRAVPVSGPSGPGARAAVQDTGPSVSLSDEQLAVLTEVAAGRDVIVDSVCGSGKTTTIKELCRVEAGKGARVLYLTFSRLLKKDAQARVGQALVQNYHGFVYPYLLRAGITCGIGESIRAFNRAFDESEQFRAGVEEFDLLVVDEYQDLNETTAGLLDRLRQRNPAMQVVLVGDLEQKVHSNTVLDAQEFALRFCRSPQLLRFTQSFRLGPELAKSIGAGWGKEIVGANPGQRVLEGSMEDALALMRSTAPGDLLVLGSRKGGMSVALNELENTLPGVFNKNTVYASIQDDDGQVEVTDGVAVFTTYDSSKGLERPVCVVIDYDETFLDARLRVPDVDPEVLRNIFLVAASRGKDTVFFVRSALVFDSEVAEMGERIGFIETDKLKALRARGGKMSYPQPLAPSRCFDFKFEEQVHACAGLIERTRLDDGSAEPIEMVRSDGLVDLSPAVGVFQEAAFFTDYDWTLQFAMRSSERRRLAREMFMQMVPGPGHAWRNSLLLTAVDTDQRRYVDQVSAVVSPEIEKALTERLGQHLDPKAQGQAPYQLRGRAVSDDAGTQIMFSGLIDAFGRDGLPYELKFTTELGDAEFLQAALYAVLSGSGESVLWNTRTDERWSIRVPDRQAFMDAVITCVSKGYYTSFEGDFVGGVTELSAKKLVDKLTKGREDHGKKGSK